MPERETPEEDLLVKAQEVPDDAFDAQLYLFETVGILISVLQEAPEQQLGFLQVRCFSITFGYSRRDLRR
jgi:exportin-T